METLVSAVLGDLISRSISFAVDRCCHRRREGTVEDSLQRLPRVLLRIRATVEEAERRRVTNRAMLRQLQLMREGMYRGYYLLDALKRQAAAAGGGGGGQDKDHGHEVSGHCYSSFASSQFNPAKRLCTLSARTTTTTHTASDTGREAEAELRDVLAGLELMVGDMKELAVFLSTYPLLSREPYSRHLWLENRMFGRDAEQERIVGFLLEPELPGVHRLGVLPVIGRARVGKSTLLEHVCLDERVREHFSLIVFLSESEIKDGNLSPQLGDSGIVKHRDLVSTKNSLVVIELIGDLDECTWRRALCTLQGESWVPVSKVLVASRSEKIAGFGTTQALELKPLPREAYWYFFRTIVFGSADPDEQPELASLCMELAGLFNGSFLAANIIGALLRRNHSNQFWRKVLTCFKDYVRMHLLVLGEHPDDRIARDRPIYFWRLHRTDDVLIVYSGYQICSAQQQDLPKISADDVRAGTAMPLPRGKFEVLGWRSHIPPYHSYLLRCGMQTPSSSLRLPTRNKKTRQRRLSV